MITQRKLHCHPSWWATIWYNLSSSGYVCEKCLSCTQWYTVIEHMVFCWWIIDTLNDSTVGHHSIAMCIENTPYHSYAANQMHWTLQVTSYWAQWRLKSPACRWFTQPLVQAVQRKYQSTASLAFVGEIHRWQVISLHKGPVTRKMFPFLNVIM